MDRTTPDPDGCWPWTAGKDWDGYGAFRAYGKPGKAHRVGYELQIGPIPEGMEVLHRCDNPSCVRGSHLFLGSNLTNVDDMIAKGRNVRGEQVGSSKLTTANIRDIRQQYAAGGISQERLGKLYGVSQFCVSAIVRRKWWKHVE